jgi:hypothetical protein
MILTWMVDKSMSCTELTQVKGRVAEWRYIRLTVQAYTRVVGCLEMKSDMADRQMKRRCDLWERLEVGSNRGGAAICKRLVYEVGQLCYQIET